MKYAYATVVASVLLFFFLFHVAIKNAELDLVHDYIDPAYKADLIIFSYDRPLQLYALLESVQKYITGLSSVTVIYRASNADYAHAYDQLYADFPSVKKLKQGAMPSADFKTLTLQAFAAGSSPYILFAVDDIIVTDHVCIADCSRALENTRAYGFYLRLGLNLDYCYSMGGSQALPNFTRIITPVQIVTQVAAKTDSQAALSAQSPEIIYTWRFAQGQHDWGYPHTVDMTIYRKKDIARDLQDMAYSSPNTLEGQWSMRAARIQNGVGLCYQQTKMVNLPLNRVQKELHNRAMDCASLSPTELLSIFMQNKKMAIAPLYKIKNKSAHMEYVPEFVTR